MKTANLIGAQLDWAVARSEGHDWFLTTPGNHLCVWKLCSLTGEQEGSVSYRPSTNWAQGGPLSEREFIELEVMPCGHASENVKFDTWRAWINYQDQDAFCASGPTPLIAAMRCYCCAMLGDEIEIPQELQLCQQPNL